MVRDCDIHYSKYTSRHIHVVIVGWSTCYKSENIGTLPYSSGFTVRAGYMLEIATLRIDIFLRLFSLCLRTGYRLLQIIIIILAIRQCVALVRSPILSALPYDKDLRCPNGWICRTPPPFSVHYRTHRLHADQICPNMSTSPNSSSFCHTQ